ncbi:MAG: hypothetical protein JXR71_01955 [Bacteroidales bacterium]|nr:hypothetical protein [Bacteroidales bacterium]
MNKKVYYLLLLLSFSGIPYFFYRILDTMVSLKYETDGAGRISGTSGRDLFLQFDIFFALTIVSFLVFVFLLIFGKRILRKKTGTSPINN